MVRDCKTCGDIFLVFGGGSTTECIPCRMNEHGESLGKAELTMKELNRIIANLRDIMEDGRIALERQLETEKVKVEEATRMLMESRRNAQALREQLSDQFEDLKTGNVAQLREEGWKNRVRGLEAELRKRSNWPDPEPEGTPEEVQRVGQLYDELVRLEGSIERMRRENERLERAVAVNRGDAQRERAEHMRFERLYNEKCEAVRRMAAEISTLRMRDSMRNSFIGMMGGGGLPDDVTPNDLIQLVHPDLHQGNPKKLEIANKLTRWALELRRNAQ